MEQCGQDSADASSHFNSNTGKHATGSESNHQGGTDATWQPHGSGYSGYSPCLADVTLDPDISLYGLQPSWLWPAGCFSWGLLRLDPLALAQLLSPGLSSIMLHSVKAQALALLAISPLLSCLCGVVSGFLSP